jgi:hypothetical protein
MKLSGDLDGNAIPYGEYFDDSQDFEKQGTQSANAKAREIEGDHAPFETAAQHGRSPRTIWRFGEDETKSTGRCKVACESTPQLKGEVKECSWAGNGGTKQQCDRQFVKAVCEMLRNPCVFTTGTKKRVH